MDFRKVRKVHGLCAKPVCLYEVRLWRCGRFRIVTDTHFLRATVEIAAVRLDQRLHTSRDYYYNSKNYLCTYLISLITAIIVRSWYMI